MPELPEIEMVRRGLALWLAGRTFIKSSSTGRHRGVNDAGIASVVGSSVGEIGRLGKYLSVQVDAQFLIIHLGMSGRLLCRDANSIDQGPHDHVTLWLDNGKALVFQDHRRFGQMFVSPTEPSAFARVGPDALNPPLSARRLADLLGQRSAQLKTSLMNQAIISGIGNIYASEILWAARLSPFRRTKSLERDDYTRLSRSILSVLRRSIQAGGATLDDYRNTNGAMGTFDQSFSVYARAGKPCRRCRTSVSTEIQDGRATYWCAGCQT
jgi:formamidopyrimidine-DNA glycosylase